ncbi:sigma-70 family RNA polymerase sigma factor [Aureimonas glaciei]|jgi:RNA polymerase sigma-70 factor (ECF subfamily)|uniref:RNA polymerase sigma factor n=1 Tax=Aureimonas glaciei TaxID=1776957 RepID=A0A917D908_9HYPH|nr:sigma-70 family RNA polymerase sigma factor [Aureimonas glaciei]GGD11209.1 RNA polymerase sigma factor [Aureimonas glaciei]
MSTDEIAARIEPLIPGLRRYAFALVRDRDAADDLVQDCLERAVGRWHLRRPDGDLRAWLFAILRNLHLSGLRQRSRRGPHVALDEMASPPAVDGDQDGRAGLRDILAGLDALSEEHRTILLLVGVEDMSYDEAARVIGLPVGTVMSRLSRAREKLRNFLETGVRSPLRRVK